MSDSNPERTTAERITLVISALILVGILGLAGWSSVRTGDAPASISVEANLDDVRETESGFYVPIMVTNTGGQTAQDVTVTGELDLGEDIPETAEITIDFLAGGETEYADLIFSSHPNEGDFTVGPTSYVQP